MAAMRLTIRQLKAVENQKKREDMKRAICEGRLVVRQMTPGERAQANRDRARGDRDRAGRAPRTSRSG
jgi:hypothetical protein